MDVCNIKEQVLVHRFRAVVGTAEDARRPDMLALLKILDELGVRFHVTHVKDFLAQQNKEINLLLVKQLLEHYGVKVQAVRTAEPTLEGLPFPLVCATQEGFLLLKQAPEVDSPFYAQWNRYALLCDPSKAKEPGAFRHELRERTLRLFPNLVRWLTGLAVVVLLISSFTWERALWVLCTLVGCLYSYRAAVNECSGSCHVVTESAGGKLLGEFSLSVIGMTYFAVTLVVLLGIPAGVPLLRWVALLALVMPLWSIPYQAFVAHAWCRNCLIVQAMVVLSAIVVLGAGQLSWAAIRWESLIALPAAYVGLLYFLHQVYTIYTKLENPSTPPELLALMKDPQLRMRIVTMGPVFPTAEVPELFTLHPEGSQELFLAISLHCSYCKKVINRLLAVIQQGGLADYRLRIAISPSPHSELVREAVAASALQEGVEQAFQRLSAWYETGNLEAFRRALSPSLDLAVVRSSLDTEAEVLKKWKLEALPSFILNGHLVAQEVFWIYVNQEKTINQG